MIHVPALVLLACCANGADDLPDGAQFVRIMRNAHAKFHDFTFAYENRVDFVGPRDLVSGDPANQTDFNDGIVSYRADGSVRNDVYVRGMRPNSHLVHRTDAMLREKLDRLYRDADTGKDATVQEKGVVGYLAISNSPFVIYVGWKFHALEDTTPYHYRCQGWEVIDSRRCLVVDLDLVPSRHPEKPVSDTRPYCRYWIDLERDGHPIRIDDYREGHLMCRATIALAPVKLPDGTSAWFPSHGVQETFRWMKDSYDTPIFRESYLNVLETALWNQNLPDSAFTIGANVGVPPSPGMAELAERFKNTKPPPPVKTDPASVQKRLDEALVKANQESRQLDASKPARPLGGWLPGLPTFLVGGGVAACIVAIILRRWQQ